MELSFRSEQSCLRLVFYCVRYFRRGSRSYSFSFDERFDLRVELCLCSGSLMVSKGWIDLVVCRISIIISIILSPLTIIMANMLIIVIILIE